MSTWFQDYVYIPLGGNRVAKKRHILNLLIVWSLTGIWHGAAWNFLIWGLYYGVLLVAEKYLLRDYLTRLPKLLCHFYAIFFIMLGWLLFRSAGFTQIITFLKAMFGNAADGLWNHQATYLVKDSANTAKKYKQLQNIIQSYGGYFCYVGVPTQSTYYANHYPDYMADRLWHTTAIRKNFGEAMSDYGIPFINMYGIYNEMGLPQDYYYATDHHFTLEGAFEAYTALLDNIRENTTWSFDSCKKTDFEWKSLQNPFLGSSNRKLFGLWNTSDAIQLAYPKENIPFVRTNNGIQVDSTVYTLPENEDELVTYSVYMGGDIGESVITTNRPKLPNILIYGDSFTNPMETLLWTQANELRSIDFRYYTQSTLKDYITEHKPDIVICVRDETAFLSEAGNGITE